jgi:hypothetical protein
MSLLYNILMVWKPLHANGSEATKRNAMGLVYFPQAILFSSRIYVFLFSSHTWIMRTFLCIFPWAVNDIFWDPVLPLVMCISNYSFSQNFTILFKIWGPFLIILLTIFGRSLIYPSFWHRHLILILLMWIIWWAPNNASRLQMGFNWAFKVLNIINLQIFLYKELPRNHKP